MTRIDINDASQVATLIKDLGDGLTLMIYPDEAGTKRGHASLWAAADNIVDVRDGKVTFLKRRNG